MNYNVKAFKELIIKYRSITKEDIYKIISDYYSASLRHFTILHKLVGIGNHNTCSLCREAKTLKDEQSSTDFYQYCRHCLHCKDTKDNLLCINHETYDNLSGKYFTTVEDLLLLIAERADYLESIVNKYESEVKDAI